MKFEKMVERVKKSNSIVIVGAGARGQDLFERLKENLISVTFFFDNDDNLTNCSIENIPILKPYKIKGENNIYIIAVDSVEIREELRTSLLLLGISQKDILTYDCYWNYDYLTGLDESGYAKEIEKRYYKIFGKKIDWKNPITYNEKINCEKLSVQNEIRTRLADKYLVKDWVKEQIGEKYVTKLYAVWDDANEINFDLLPNAFVLKMNNGSGRNIIVKDKSKIDQDIIRKQLNEWKERNFAYVNFELQYKDIIPKIICEEYLEGVAEEVYDYNIYCFHGEPKYIWCIKGSHRPGCKASFYDKNWEMQPFSYGYPKDEEIAPRPEKLEEMLNLSRILCKGFEHIRVDWYNLPDGRVLFGEMTFSSWAGLKKFVPNEYDEFFGNLI